jgi:COP9 signalosome complex subunit 6
MCVLATDHFSVQRRLMWYGLWHTDKQVFPSLDFIGWYTVAPQPTARHIAFHEQVRLLNPFLTHPFPDLHKIQFVAYTSTPLLLLLQPGSVGAADVAAGGLPFRAYEPTIEIRERKSRSVFIQAAYTVETGEAERIAVDWTAKGGGGGTSRACCRLYTSRASG